jgi:hypothetical protein
MNIDTMDEDDAAATALASSVEIDDVSLSLNLTIDPLFLKRGFFVFSIENVDLALFQLSSSLIAE